MSKNFFAVFFLMIFFQDVEVFGRNSNNCSFDHDTLSSGITIKIDCESDGVCDVENGMKASDLILDFARSYLGTRYRKGGMQETGFDCSGFVSFVFGNFGIKLPHTSGGQSVLGDPVVNKNAKPGDVVYFKGHNSRSKRVGHVGIVVENNNGEIIFIHSSSNHGIRYDSTKSPYYRARFLGTRRFINNDRFPE